MRVTSVELHPANSSDICVLSFRDPTHANPYNVKEIIGLDADEIVPRFYGGSGNSKFYNLLLEKREIVIRVELNPKFGEFETFSDLRDKLYRLIASSRTGIIQIQFKDGAAAVAALSGFVTKVEAGHFNKAQEVQLTISCNNPTLQGIDPIIVDVGELNTSFTNIQDTLSTAPHGFIFEMGFQDNVGSFIIGDPTGLEWTFEVTPVGGFLTYDVLHFSSEHNSKHIYLMRGVNTIHLADVITPGSVWPVLFPGDNEFICENASVIAWDSISYYPTYWGV